MDVATEQEQQQHLRNPATGTSWHDHAHQGQVEQQSQGEEEQGGQHSPIQRVDTPCPAALRRQHRQVDTRTQGGSFVLLPECAERGSRRFIPLEAGQTTVVSLYYSSIGDWKGEEEKGWGRCVCAGCARENTPVVAGATQNVHTHAQTHNAREQTAVVGDLDVSPAGSIQTCPQPPAWGV